MNIKVSPCVVSTHHPSTCMYNGFEILPGIFIYPFETEEMAKMTIEKGYIREGSFSRVKSSVLWGLPYGGNPR